MCCAAENGKAGSEREDAGETDEAALVQRRGKLHAQLKASRAAVSPSARSLDFDLSAGSHQDLMAGKHDRVHAALCCELHRP